MRALTSTVDPRPLAVARMGVAVAVLMTTLQTYATLLDVATGAAALPLADWMPAVTEGRALAYCAAVLTAAAFVLAGLFTRTAAGIVAISTWSAFAWEQQTYSNHLMLCAWLALWLALGRSDAVWSVRARVSGRSEASLSDQVLLMTQLSTCYLFAGVTKLHAGFLGGDELRSHADLALPDGAYAVLAVGAVAMELLLAVGLWVRRAHRWVIGGGVLMHLGIVVVMVENAWSLTAFGIACVALYPLFRELHRCSSQVDTP